MVRRQASISYPGKWEPSSLCVVLHLSQSPRCGIICRQSNEDMRGLHSRGLLSSYWYSWSAFYTFTCFGWWCGRCWATAALSIINVVVAAVFKFKPRCEQTCGFDRCYSCPTSFPLTWVEQLSGWEMDCYVPPQLIPKRWICLSAVWRLLYIQPPSQVANLHLRKLCRSTVDFICRPILMMISRSTYIPLTSLSLSHSQQAIG